MLLDLGRRHLDLLLVVLLTLVAAALRLWALGDIPPGLHGDEALTGLDSERIQHEGWIGPYVGSALGQPTGPLYWTALVLEVTGHGVFAVRAAMALLGIITVPSTYFAVRQMYDRRVALFAAAILAVMAWHLLYSRTAFLVVSWPLAELITLGLLFAALKRQSNWLYAATGVALGLGMYSYNVYPLFVVGVGVFAIALVAQAGAERWALAGRLALMLACALVVALPLLLYAADGKNDYFSHHRVYSYLSSQEYRAADLGGRLELLGTKAKDWLAQMLWRKHPDFVDAAGMRPMVDWLTTGLATLGVVICLRRLKQPANQLLLLMLLLLPVASIVSIDGGFRRSLGLAPVVAVLAALPLAGAWRLAGERSGSVRSALYLVVALAVVALGVINVRAYFRDLGDSPLARWVYAQQIAAASEYIADLPEPAYVYFYSSRWSFNYETRQYLAPGAVGEDRSKEFGRRQGFDIDRARPSLILLLPPYTQQIESVRRLYPDGRAFAALDRGETLFIAYHLPARAPVSALEAGPAPSRDSGASPPR